MTRIKIKTDVQLQRGNTRRNLALTKDEGMLTYDRDLKSIRVHDGQTPGGAPLTPEAPTDGQQYVRQDEQWVPAGGGSLDAGALPTLPDHFVNSPVGQAFIPADMAVVLDQDGRLLAAGGIGAYGSNPPVWQSDAFQELLPDKRFVMVAGACWYPGFLALDTNGQIWGAGWSDNGHVGGGGKDVVWPPTKINDDTDWVFIACTDYSASFGIKRDGTLWAWGNNMSQQLGIEGRSWSDEAYAPIQVGTDTDWRYIEAVQRCIFGYKDNGDLYIWGEDMGTDDTGDPPVLADQHTPRFLGNYPDGAPMSKITSNAGRWTVWVKPDGTLWARGDNRDHIPSGATSEVFVDWQQIGTDTDWAFVNRPGSWQILSVYKTDGSMYLYGTNYEGTIYDTPTLVADGTTFQYAISGYESIVFSMTATGDLWAHGENWSGQAGVGTTTDLVTPQLVGSDYEWVVTSFYRTVAQKTDGTLEKWGSMWNGDMGCPQYTDDILSPSPLNYCPI